MQVEATRLAHLVTEMKKAGIDAADVNRALARHGLISAVADPDAHTYPYETEALLFREACDMTGDLTFAARTGLSWKSFGGLTGYISKYSKDVRRAVENTSRYHEIVSPALGWQLHVSGNAATIQMIWKDASFAKYHRHLEFLMFAVLSRLRIITQTSIYPLELRLDHEVGASAGHFQKQAGFPVVFGAERPEIILPLSALDLPIPTYDLKLRQHLMDLGERLLAERRQPERSLRARVDSLILSALPVQVPTAEEAAVELGMSPRTFARRLRENGLTYREIVDAIRSDLAQTFLKDKRTLSEIAFALGYADQAAFSTAFKRWTGVAPSAFRPDV